MLHSTACLSYVLYHRTYVLYLHCPIHYNSGELENHIYAVRRGTAGWGFGAHSLGESDAQAREQAVVWRERAACCAALAPGTLPWGITDAHGKELCVRKAWNESVAALLQVPCALEVGAPPAPAFIPPPKVELATLLDAFPSNYQCGESVAEVACADLLYAVEQRKVLTHAECEVRCDAAIGLLPCELQSTARAHAEWRLTQERVDLHENVHTEQSALRAMVAGTNASMGVASSARCAAVRASVPPVTAALTIDFTTTPILK